MVRWKDDNTLLRALYKKDHFWLRKMCLLRGFVLRGLFFTLHSSRKSVFGILEPGRLWRLYHTNSLYLVLVGGGGLKCRSKIAAGLRMLDEECQSRFRCM
jgi:hypothetical protein